MKKNGFTLIELLIIIAIVALLTAIAVPSLMAAKNRARSILCSSNLHQLSVGFFVYQQENEAIPYGFDDSNLGTAIPAGGYVGNPVYDKQGLWWFNYLQSVVELDLKGDSIAQCPAKKLNRPDLKRNILCGNYGVNRSVCKDAQGETSCPFRGNALRSDHVRMPSVTYLISDSGYSLISWLAAADTADPVFENPNRIDSFYIPGLELNQARPELADNMDAIKGRHPHQTLNMGFVDGHSEARSAESLRIMQTIADDSQLPALWKP